MYIRTISIQNYLYKSWIQLDVHKNQNGKYFKVEKWPFVSKETYFFIPNVGQQCRLYMNDDARDRRGRNTSKIYQLPVCNSLSSSSSFMRHENKNRNVQSFTDETDALLITVKRLMGSSVIYHVGRYFALHKNLFDNYRSGSIQRIVLL